MWPNYIVRDNYLSKKHFDSISNIEFDTKPDEWDIYKHLIFKDGEIKTGFQSSTGASSFTAEEIRGYGAKNRIPKKVTEKMLRQHKHIKSNSPLSEDGGPLNDIWDSGDWEEYMSGPDFEDGQPQW